MYYACFYEFLSEILVHASFKVYNILCILHNFVYATKINVSRKKADIPGARYEAEIDFGYHPRGRAPIPKSHT